MKRKKIIKHAGSHWINHRSYATTPEGPKLMSARELVGDKPLAASERRYVRNERTGEIRRVK